ncbi:MAG: plasmid pRiA4b ORF-3 family protein [Chloroflexi bacterium]|nr:MAG: plasmid pRiA4b ORF-3 family protein [Chloroflexota bacterium]
MTRQISKGTCTFCHGEFSKASMTRHLESCEQRVAIQAEARSHQQAQKTRAFHLVVEGYRLPMYWMHLEVSAGTTLATLDHFLRDTWLECCGHLSAFTIGGVRYSVDAAIYEWDMGSKNMQVPLDQVLHPGHTCSYEYDFGSTTELALKVISEREVPAKKKAIEILARNNLPLVSCDVCGKPATTTCTQCIYEDKGWLCDACAKDHECGEEMLWPMVNSPRAGVCGYTGQDPAYIW